MNTKTPKLFDYINDLSFGKKNLSYNLDGYNSFMTDKFFSFHPDTILYANEMNMCQDLPVEMHHDFYYYGVNKRKRFGKWPKSTKDEIAEKISTAFNINLERAFEYIDVLPKEDIDEIINTL